MAMLVIAKDPFEKEVKTCQPITVDMCKSKFSTNTGYASTLFPNRLYRTQDEAKTDLVSFSQLIAAKCHRDIALFLCAQYVPLCIEELKMALKPCRSLCEEVKSGCGGLMKAHGHDWPFDCSKYPPHGEVCVSGLKPSTTKAPTTIALNVTMTTKVTKSNNKTKGKPKRKRGKVSGVEGSNLEIKCKKGQMVVIKKVSHKESECCPELSKQILSVMCHRKKTCRFEVSQKTFGGHCMEKVGSVAVKYKCEKNRKNKKQLDGRRCPMKR